MLLGRAQERARIDLLLAEAAAGAARCLVLDGEPGVGKTELLAYAASVASGFRVLRTTGVESELELGFAGLVELVRPVLDLLEVVPQGQMAALKAALGLGPPATASRLLVAAGLLSLIASAAQREPVLVLVDDFQWVDAPSAQALLFAARRLRADRVAVLVTYRSGERLPVQTVGLSQVPITGLDHEAASELLSGRAPGLAALVVDELHSSTAGNPLAMLEILSRLSSRQRAGLEALPAPLPSVGGIEEAFYRRVSDLSQAAQHALVLVSASGDADLALLGPALVECGYTVSDLGPAVEAGLLQLEGGRAAWRHPLVRSAVYHRSPGPSAGPLIALSRPALARTVRRGRGTRPPQLRDRTNASPARSNRWPLKPRNEPGMLPPPAHTSRRPGSLKDGPRLPGDGSWPETPPGWRVTHPALSGYSRRRGLMPTAKAYVGGSWRYAATTSIAPVTRDSARTP